jgi:hypothetical protein
MAKAALKRTVSRNALKPPGLQIRKEATVADIMTAFEEFKRSNDERLARLSGPPDRPRGEHQRPDLEEAHLALEQQLRLGRRAIVSP